ncbi:septation protein SepH [Kribbella sp. NPDC048928]|uniref:septation protein SepH n=1 Tax=Kribbella sp. NPDC048928 TaxID=3364111 RepID=UPI00371C65FC
MREARLVGLSQDGTQLVLAMAETGEEFAVPVDDRLRAALRGDRARLGQLEIQMESALRPRDIQARIRAGESPEAVAAVAQMPMERVMAFAGPVLAERDHIASLAQRASVRRRGGGDAPTRNLGAWVTDRLRLRQIDPASAEWDAWRREDGRWAVRVSYFVESEDTDDSGEEQKEEKIAMFAYDAPGRYAVPDDDEARWLVGEQAQVLPTPVQPQPGERRLAAVADIDPMLAPDHGADSYEAGFEDTVSLRRRNHPVSRDEPQGHQREVARGNRDLDRGARDAEPRAWDAERGQRDLERGARDVTRGQRGQEPGTRDAERAQRDGEHSAREVERGQRDFERGARDGARGPRRVHSVPNPDEEPTLIDVPVDQPPAPRPSVRAVERPTDPPAFASPADAPTEHEPTLQEQARQVRQESAREDLDRRDDASAATEVTEATEATKAGEPAANAQPELSDDAAAAQAGETPAEPKKKPARRGKRASVPSWDEIMFGKKAD